MIPNSIFSFSWIFCCFDIIESIIPEKMYFWSFWIIWFFCGEIDSTSGTITIHLVFSYFIMVGFDFPIIFNKCNWRILIDACHYWTIIELFISNDWFWCKIVLIRMSSTEQIRIFCWWIIMPRQNLAISNWMMKQKVVCGLSLTWLCI